MQVLTPISDRQSTADSGFEHSFFVSSLVLIIAIRRRERLENNIHIAYYNIYFYYRLDPIFSGWELKT